MPELDTEILAAEFQERLQSLEETYALIQQIAARQKQMKISDRELCRRGNICDNLWSKVKKGKRSPSLLTILRAARAVGLVLELRPVAAE